MMAPSMRSARPALSAWRRIPGPPRDLVGARLLRLYRGLLRRFGPQGWWPGHSPFEIAAGAILTQHTAWSQAAPAVAALRARRLLSPRALAAAPEGVVAEAIRPAGADPPPTPRPRGVPARARPPPPRAPPGGGAARRPIPPGAACPLRRDLAGRPPRL